MVSWLGGLNDSLDSNPARPHAMPFADEARGVFLEDKSDRLTAYAGTFPFYFPDCEFAFGFVQDRNHVCGLLAFFRDKGGESLLEFGITFIDRVQQIVDVGPRIVSALVPSDG